MANFTARFNAVKIGAIGKAERQTMFFTFDEGEDMVKIGKTIVSEIYATYEHVSMLEVTHDADDKKFCPYCGQTVTRNPVPYGLRGNWNTCAVCDSPTKH